MTIFKPNEPPHEAYVWIWLPEMTEPVVAGKLTQDRKLLLFNYGKSYLQRDDAISLSTLELPLQSGLQRPLAGLEVAGCIRDAAPDAWGRRVVLRHLLGTQAAQMDTNYLSELTYLLASGSDRIGALDFQLSATNYVARNLQHASLAELLSAAERLEQGQPLNPELDVALLHGSSIGGARPKALIDRDEGKYIGKFSSTTDLYNVVKAEFVAMRLAAHCGLDVAPVKLVQAAGRDVVLIERFDRIAAKGSWRRRMLVSALSLLGLDEMMARYASYQDLAELIRQHFYQPQKTLRELFARLVFNILIGNSDDHARNHAAFYDGQMFTLSPAYDLCPQARSGHEASQAMLISGQDRRSRISTCLSAAPHFMLSNATAREIVAAQIETIARFYVPTCELAQFSPVDRALLWGRQILNPYAFDDLTGSESQLRRLATELRAGLKM